MRGGECEKDERRGGRWGKRRCNEMKSNAIQRNEKKCTAMKVPSGRRWSSTITPTTCEHCVVPM